MMKKRYLFILNSFFISLILSSCNKDNYLPKKLNETVHYEVIFRDKEQKVKKLRQSYYVIKAKDNKVRRFSTTTVLSLSDDLEGGDFGIRDETGFEVNVNLQERDTLLFESNTEHQVYPVTKGKRVVLVAWIYDK